MFEQTIGVNAGKIWSLLSEKGKMSPTAISRILGMKATEVDRALGWLAREDKLLVEPARQKGIRVWLKN